MFQLSLKWLLPKLLALKAIAGASAAVVHLVQKLYEAKQVISQDQKKTPLVSASPPGSPSNGEESDSIDLGIEELEDIGPTPDEDGFTY